ncbi:MAG: D-aminoacylase [Acidobacteria bacterium]|nr:D-aminoacylase [Acidobacteriota bacterium]
MNRKIHFLQSLRSEIKPCMQLFAGLLCALLLAPAALAQAAPAKPATFVIVGADVADGAGKPLRKMNVRIGGDRIVKIGNFQPRKDEQVIQADGLVLAPGFMDMHNHSDRGLESQPLAETQISQGITTLLLGQDGSSAWPVGEYLERRRKDPPALNVAMCVGHATVRRKVMGEDYQRVARPEEVAQMAKLVEQGMQEGAACLSSGLEYVVGSYASTEEVVALARAAAKHGGFYISHIRDEADKAFEAMREVVTIGEQAKLPVQNTHIKLGTVGVWGKAAEVIRLYDEARKRGVDVSADCYPYDAWHSNMKVLVPSKRWDDPVDVQKALDDVGGAQNILITEYDADHSYEGKTLEEVAKARGITAVALYIEMVKNGDAGIIGKTMIEADIKTLYQWPWTMVSSDGGIGMKHPRGAGTFPKVLGRFVREKQWLTLPEAVRKMTSLPAWRLKLKDRGTIKKGNVADLVLFNPATVIDNSTFEEPMKLSTGIEKVWVNGMLVWDAGKATGARPGRVVPK